MGVTLRFFIAGIIQGSLPSATHSQDYRQRIAQLIRKYFPGADVFDPVERYPDSLSYDEVKGKAAFLDLMQRAGQCDILIAFVPEASMGTAIELWQASQAGKTVVCVSPLKENWVVKFLSARLVADFSELEQLIASGELARMHENKQKKAM